MPSRRIAKVNQAILETISSTILFELRDPRVQHVTILDVDTTFDLKACKVRVGVRGDAKAQSLTLHGLESARGFLQSRIAARLDTRYTPILKFVLEPNWLETLTATSDGFSQARATAIEIESDTEPNGDQRDSVESFEGEEEVEDDTSEDDTEFLEIEGDGDDTGGERQKL